jgi:omega-6 fatty acid desaturase (delta-12 desaturase)
VAVEAPDRAKVAFWNQTLSPFFGADTRRSVIQLTLTSGLFFGFWILAYLSLSLSYWLTLVLCLAATGFLVRLFMIQHDCGHGSYFKSRKARDRVGFLIGVLTLTPYEYWRKTHAYHHAHSGDLDLRGFGDINTLTVEEYRQKSRLGRLGYRLYRNPLVLFGVGAVFHFVVIHRYPWTTPREWTRAWRSVWLTNGILATLLAVFALTIGLKSFLLVHAPIVLFTCSFGVWLFYVQHQFEETYWYRKPKWDYYDAALEGSSYLALPRPLQWLTANIGVHHVHHLNARIPNYRLQEAMKSVPELQHPTRVTILNSLRLMGLTLWDEVEGRLVSFREAGKLLNQRVARSNSVQ